VSAVSKTAPPAKRVKARQPRQALYAAAAALIAIAAVAAALLGKTGGSGHRGGAAAPPVVVQPPAISTGPGRVSTAGGGAASPAARTGAGGGGAGALTAKPSRAGGGSAAGSAVAVAEVRDPEEAKSFPLPASTHHAPATTPSVAGEAGVAPGAASDAQIRKELGEEAQAKAQELAARQRALTPVPGGSSVGGNGTIPIPTNVPEAVQRVIAGGNAIADFPYIWGGGHASFVANGYDCSGSVSYALAAGGLLSAPLVSGELASWGDPGPGRWITIYANAGHTFMDVDGVWFDTAGRSGPYASRWLLATPPLEGYAVRHPPGY